MGEGVRNKQAGKIAAGERERGPLIENSRQQIRGEGDPVCCTDRAGMCGQMMMTGPVTALPLCVSAKAHLRPLSACEATSSASLQVRVRSLPNVKYARHSALSRNSA